MLSSRRFSLAEKLSFFQFTGFYVGQTVLLLYLIVTFLIAPFFFALHQFSWLESLIAGSAIVLIIYLPILAYFLKQRSLTSWIGTAIMAALVYGPADFSCARGVWDCLRKRKRRWIPTNALTRQSRNWALALEAVFGLALFVVPLLVFPLLFWLPCAYLFAGKFLFSPAMRLLYDDRRKVAPASGWAWKLGAAAIVLPLGLATTMASSLPARDDGKPAALEIRGKQFYLDAKPFLVKGIHYGPWRPGAGPNKGHPFPGPDHIEQDMKLIRQTHANTILVYDPPGYVLDLAHKHDLKVLYCFSINWWAIGSPEYAGEVEHILQRVRENSDKPALLAWVLGNEIPIYAVAQRGEEPIVRGLRELYQAIKTLDPHHPVTHSNWPITKDLDLRFFDFASFNLYPLWPPDVVAMGYGNYIKNVLQPVAGNKPLLLTEYGVNDIEAGPQGQAKYIQQCWRQLLAAGACGGFAFEFADQWWKNYDNPIHSGVWWSRVPAPDDELQHDLDPEEHYGLLTADRQPKPAFHALKELYAAAPAQSARFLPATIIAAIALLAFGSWLWARRKARPSPQPLPAETTAH